MNFQRSLADARVQPPMGGPPPRRIGAYGYALLVWLNLLTLVSELISMQYVSFEPKWSLP